MSLLEEKYVGGAFYKHLPGGKTRGHLKVFSTHIVFEAMDQDLQVQMPLDPIEVTRGGASNRLLFFKSPSLPDWVFYTSDISLIKRDEILVHPEILKQVGAIKKQTASRWALVVSVFVFMIVGVWGLFQLKNPLADWALTKITPEIEQEYTEDLAPYLIGAHRAIHDKELLSALRKLVEPVMQAADLNGYKPRIFLVKDKQINAFAFPGGNIVFNSGLLLRAETSEQILGVFAHELAHVTQRHVVRGIVDNLGLFALFQLVVGDISGVAAIFVNQGQNLLRLKFSRDKESEADRLGLERLKAAGVNPVGMKGFFQLLQQEHKVVEKISENLSMLSTHPATSERIKEIDNWIEKNVGQIEFKPVDFDLTQFKKDLQEHISNQP